MFSSTDKKEQSPKQPSSTSRIFKSFTTEVRLNYKTIINACVNACGSMISATYWLAQMSDDIDGLDGQGADKFVADMSIVGLPLGVGFALLITFGSVYAHYILNTNSNFAAQSRRFSLPFDDDDPDIKARIALTPFQRVMLFLDFFSHTADGAGPVLLIYSVGVGDPARISRIESQIVATLIGSLAAIADVITCGHNMRLHNKNVILDNTPSIDGSPHMLAGFFGGIMRKLEDSFTGNKPRAAEFFGKIADLLEEAAVELEADDLPAPHQGKIYEITREEEEEEDSAEYHLIVNDEEKPTAEDSVALSIRGP
jgi:hypothetical protein